MHEPLRITLVETAPPGQRGSMARYADLVAAALAGEGCIAPVELRRVNLALPEAALSKVPSRLRSWAHHAWVARSAQGKLAGLGGDIFHIVDGSHAYVARWLPPRGAAVVTAHDVIPLLQATGRFPAPPPGPLARWLIGESIGGLKRAARIVADSSRTRDDLVEAARLDRDRIAVVPPAIPPELNLLAGRDPAVPWSERRRLPGAYMLHVGNNGFYKNRAGALRVFARIRESAGLRLVMAGSPPTPVLSELIRSLGLDGAVDFVADPGDNELAELYRHAALFLFPSLYEGFGWPPLEAMTFGCPVVCSSAGSLPEVVGDAALLCPPDREERMAGLCCRVLGNETLAEELVAKGFRRTMQFGPERMREELMRVYQQAAGCRITSAVAEVP